MRTKIGFIGLGFMGMPMAYRLLKTGGYQLFVYNRTKEKAAGILKEGAHWCASPSEVAGNAEIIFTMVSNPAALEEVSLSPNGILSGFQPNCIHVDTSTVSPEIVGRLEKQYQSKRAHFLHSPVLGSIPQATDGSLLLFVGGEENAFRRAEPVLKVLGRRMWRFDAVEAAAHTKLLCNSFIAGMICTLTQALVYARKAEVNAQVLIEIIGTSALNSTMYQTKGGSIIERNFNPRFFLELMLKDINLFVESGKTMGVPLPAVEVAQRLFSEAAQSGLGKEDYSAIVKILEKRAGLEVHQ